MNGARKSKRDLCRSLDLERADIDAILRRAVELKAALRRGEPHDLLRGRTLAMIFEKPSLRTRCTFEIGMFQLGGHAIYLQEHEIGMGKREAVEDVAHNLERWFDLVMARTHRQSTIEDLARHCRLPVINALSDEEHPCQALADMLTLAERFGSLGGFRLTYVGDGNNICHSLMLIGAALGMRITVSSPPAYRPRPEVEQAARERAAAAGGGAAYAYVEVPSEAVAEAQAIYTDVWASMGQESEAARRAKDFRRYQVNADLVAAAPAGTLIMHDLPAHRGEEITADVIDGPNSIVFDQAENRLHAQKAVMVFLHDAIS